MTARDEYEPPRAHFDAYYSRAEYEREKASDRLDDEIAEAIDGAAADYAIGAGSDADWPDFWSRAIAIAVDRCTTACKLPNGSTEDASDLSLLTWVLADTKNLRRVRKFLVDACDGLHDTPEELADEAADICARAGI